MKRFFAAALALLALCGCAAQNGGGGGYIFTDDLGREVSVSEHKRTAALLGSFADIWLLSGGELCAAADDAWVDFELAMPEEAINLGNTKRPSMELLFEAEPDFVMASANTRANVEMKETLEAAGLTVAYFDVSDFEDYLRMLKICTEITGRPELYEKNGEAVRAGVDEAVQKSKERIKKAGKAPTVLLLRASAGSLRVKGSDDNVAGEMLKSLGCVNIADNERTLLENLSLERIVEADPDFIFLLPIGDDLAGAERRLEQELFSHPVWSRLSAVEAGRVFRLEKRLYTLKPNARWGEAYSRLEEMLWDEG